MPQFWLNMFLNGAPTANPENNVYCLPVAVLNPVKLRIGLPWTLLTKEIS